MVRNTADVKIPTLLVLPVPQFPPKHPPETLLGENTEKIPFGRKRKGKGTFCSSSSAVGGYFCKSSKGGMVFCRKKSFQLWNWGGMG